MGILSVNAILRQLRDERCKLRVNGVEHDVNFFKVDAGKQAPQVPLLPSVLDRLGSAKRVRVPRYLRLGTRNVGALDLLGALDGRVVHFLLSRGDANAKAKPSD